jgi:transposase
VYWKPIYNLFEGSLAVLVVNAQHIKQVPGRKTDVKDAEWIAMLVRHGLVRASFIPDRGQRELRELTRYRTSLIRERAAEVNRLHKTLEGANIKLAAVASDVLGLSGRQMLAALVAGETDAGQLAQLAHGQLREKIPQLERALAGCVGPHQRFLLSQQLVHIDDLEAVIARVSGEIAARLRPFEAAVAHLDSIPGVGRLTAEVLVAEIGVDMGRFPSPAHLASWAGLAPGQHESAGKHKSGRTRKGSPWLRSALVEAAQAIRRTKDTALKARYTQIQGRRGSKRALVANARQVLETAYYLLLRQEDYAEQGAQAVRQRDRERTERRLVKRLEALGNHVVLTPGEPAA